jgi:hypothetical protein
VNKPKLVIGLVVTLAVGVALDALLGYFNIYGYTLFGGYIRSIFLFAAFLAASSAIYRPAARVRARTLMSISTALLFTFACYFLTPRIWPDILLP